MHELRDTDTNYIRFNTKIDFHIFFIPIFILSVLLLFFGGRIISSISQRLFRLCSDIHERLALYELFGISPVYRQTVRASLVGSSCTPPTALVDCRKATFSLRQFAIE
jgi:hypothetical protein